MKRLFAFAAGVLVGFLSLETIAVQSLGWARPTRVTTSSSVEKAIDETMPATGAEPAPVVTGPRRVAGSTTVRPASKKPEVFFLGGLRSLPPNAISAEMRQRLAAPDRAALRSDASFMAAYREIVRAAAIRDMRAQVFFAQLNTTKANQIVEIQTDEIIDWQLLPRLDRNTAPVARQRLSDNAAARLADVLNPEELETWAEFASGLNAQYLFQSTVEAFASHGLPLPAREELDALIPPTTKKGSDGLTYRARQFNPAAAPDSLSAQQRAFLANLDRWRRASLIVSSLVSTMVRDPDVWEIWPD